VLRRIFGYKRDEVTEDSTKLYDEELYDMYSTNMTRMTKSRIMRWVEHVARMVEIRVAYTV
jgi:hypothetical protein